MFAFDGSKLMVGNSEVEEIDRIQCVRHLLKIEEAQNAEERAELAHHAFAKIAERLMRPFLVKMRALLAFSDGCMPTRPPPTLGALVNELAPKLMPYPGLLIDEHLAHVRNAEGHPEGNNTYVPESDAIKMWDVGRQGTIWTRELSARAVEERAARMFVVAGHLMRIALDAHMLEAFVRPQLRFVRPIASALSQNDTRALERINAEMKALLEGIFAEVRNLTAT